MLVTLKEILKEKGNDGAVGAFNTVNLASIRAVIAAAENLDQPVILQHAQIHEAIAPLSIIGPVMLQMAEQAKVPIAVHLDHGTDQDYLIRAMKMGFTSVMFDGSSLTYDENVSGTQKIVQIAKKYGVSVEAELGRVLRPEGATDNEADEELQPEDFYTQPEEASVFIEQTEIDALAIAFGTAHGIYEAEPKLDFDRIAAIQKMVNVPLVMHGGSGVSDQDFVNAIKKGIKKVNYFTYMSLAGGEAVQELIASNQKQSIRFDEMDAAARHAMQKHVEHAIRIFSFCQN